MRESIYESNEKCLIVAVLGHDRKQVNCVVFEVRGMIEHSRIPFALQRDYRTADALPNELIHPNSMVLPGRSQSLYLLSSTRILT
jgi:hypothetical protein